MLRIILMFVGVVLTYHPDATRSDIDNFELSSDTETFSDMNIIRKQYYNNVSSYESLEPHI